MSFIQVILSTVSSYFQNIFLENSHTRHPIIILPTEIPPRNLRYLLDFIYTGKAMVPKEHLLSVLQTASQLGIKGLSGDFNMQNTIIPVLPTVSGSSPAATVPAGPSSTESSLDLSMTNGGTGKKAAAKKGRKRSAAPAGASEDEDDARPNSALSSNSAKGRRKKTRPERTESM